MKAIISTLGLVLTLSLAASANTKTPLVNKREKNQKQRIVQGIKSGNLNFRETAKLLNKEADIRRDERIAKSDGNVTFGERFRLQRELNHASRTIRNKKTN